MKTFAELDLIPPVQQALAEENYETPTPIQAQTIPPALRGRDVLGCAQTGTGKTAAFAVPILNRLGSHNRKAPPHRPFVLVLAPTRELAIQIDQSFSTYGTHLKLRQTVIYGGVNQTRQVRTLKRGAHILVATPGRLIDLMNQGHIHLDLLDVFVLDEADRMLDMGFLPDLKRIISQLPNKRQSLFFSATMPDNIIELSQSLLSNPVSVDVTPEQVSVEKIEQQVHFVDRRGKQELLRAILQSPDVVRALVFTKTKRRANVVTKQLIRKGVGATVIHGNKSQGARVRALEDFRSGRARVLVATDVAARGIDIDGITHVINLDIPIEPEAYVHRIGRTGRAGAEGVALSFCSPEEQNELRAIERLIGQKVPAANSPSQQGSDGQHPAIAPGNSQVSGGAAPGPTRRQPPRTGQPDPNHRFRSGQNQKRGRKRDRQPDRQANQQQGSAHGQIKLITHKGFGFIGNGGAKDLFFHRSAVEGIRFEDLRQGQQVSFTVGQGPRGPCATNVQVM
ncbi:MAG TPA: DEAD/DEAH box helicase [Planctomycetaceae bacterium]|nr:DEAD/DEAH box helicase [Planctomycetaceae bacterium]